MPKDLDPKHAWSFHPERLNDEVAWEESRLGSGAIREWQS